MFGSSKQQPEFDRFARNRNSLRSVAVPQNVEFDYAESPNVIVRNVSKTFVIGSGQMAGFGQILKRKSGMTVEAVKNVSLVASPGESIGIIGVNGSGKSTLLNMIAGAESVTNGEILVRDKPTLMGVSPVLQPNLSGESNIYIGCLALGMSPEEAREQVGEIAAWTELGDAVKRPMSTYSSGMSARLSFAISTSVRPKILMIDESLSTGDTVFASKAEARMANLLGNAGNLFLVSHSIGQIEKNCHRAIWIHQGEVVADGETEVVAPKYHEWARLMGKEDKTPAHKYLAEVSASYQPPLVILD